MDYIHLADDQLMGSCQWEGGLSLLNIVLIGIAKELPEHNGNHSLHRLLNAMLSAELSAAEKLGIMETEYHIPLDEKLRKDVNVMCNLSQGIEEKGRMKGLAEGEKKIILTMHHNNFTLEQISLATGKSVEEIKGIIEKTQFLLA